MEKAGTGARRTYNQYCGLASALDVLGERWTLLIIRELLMGPRRYTDLLADLPGVGTNLLAERLKTLVERGLVEQIHPAGGGARMSYALTWRKNSSYIGSSSGRTGRTATRRPSRRVNVRYHSFG